MSAAMKKKPTKKPVKKPTKKPAPKPKHPEPISVPVASTEPEVVEITTPESVGATAQEWLGTEEQSANALESQASEMFDDVTIVDGEETAIVPVTKEEAAKPINGYSLKETIDREQKIVYIMDASGSMSSKMAPEDPKDLYDWSPEVLEKFSDKIQLEFQKDIQDEQFAKGNPVPKDDDESLMKAAAVRFLEEGLDEKDNLIQYILDEGLVDKYITEIQVPVKGEYSLQTESRSQAMRGAMKKFVQQRFQKWPQSKVELIEFDSSPSVRAEAGATLETLLTEIDNIGQYGGGTDIHAAVSFALRRVNQSPSPVNANHLILVTDGEDHRAINVENLLPTMKKLGVVFDYIFVKGSNSHVDDSVANVLKKVCNETGGEYAEVTKSSDFTQKFFEMSNRLCLPPARSL